MRPLAALLLLLGGASLARAQPSPAARTGVLLLAHGGDKRWNDTIEALRDQVSASTPAALALGMADPDTLQKGVDELEKRGVDLIVVVPLFVNSHSEVMDQTRFALGLTEQPSEVMRRAAERMKNMPMPPGMDHHHMNLFSLTRVSHRARIALAPALDSDAFISTILLARAAAISSDPAKESVVLVAHGPVDDAAVKDWETALAAHCAFVAKEGKFRACRTALLRDDAAPEVRAKSVAGLRAQVAAGVKNGDRVLVVPVLIARGGIEDKIPKDLAGLDFAWSGDALIPYGHFDLYVLRRAREVLGTP